MSKFTFNRIITYFLRGLIFVVPVALTIYVIYQSLEWIDSLIPVEIPGIGLIIILAAVTFLGYLASFFITRPFFEYFEKYFIKIPLVNIIYTSLKDLIGAFVGDQKKFNKPVIVAMDESRNLLKVGFITKEDLKNLDLDSYISVYMPHSYAWSGNQFLVNTKCILPLNMTATEAMKFVVSGGVSGLENVKVNDKKTS